MNNDPILIVAGEPNSIFSEILVKSFKHYNKQRPIILFISKRLLIEQLNKINLKLQLHFINSKNKQILKLSKKKLNIVDVNYKFNKPFEKPSSKSNKYIEECFDKAINLAKTMSIAGLINGPINKNYFLKNKFFGITEYLSKKLKIKKNKFAMLIYNKNLSVSPITTHLPIKFVVKNINKKLIEDKVILIHKFYKKFFSISPKIAITGLNPHCENFLSKSEEESIIIPTIKRLIKKKIKVEGPFSADTIFIKEQLKKFDSVVGMYHDQVLTPIKAIYGFDAINITLGLPFLRISPDHGPNSKMIGKNKSDHKSLLLALNFLSKQK